MSKEKILIIPDVHGRKFWRSPINNIDEYEHVVFLGDYLDPYTMFEQITIDDAIIGLEDILELKNDYPEKVTLLLGNHDLHYYWPKDMDCTRKCYDKLDMLHQLYRDNRHLFNLAYKREIAGKKYFFTHAGILKNWILENNTFLADYLMKAPSQNNTECFVSWLNSLLDTDGFGILGQVARCRGGYDEYGSPIWADVHEHLNTKSLEDIYQIFGHTLMEHEVITDTFACLDCCKPFELSLHNGALSELKKKKILFLDFDGVMNSSRHMHMLASRGEEQNDPWGAIFDPIAVENLARIVDETGTDIVITSTWKHLMDYEAMLNMWSKRNLPGFVTDLTPTCSCKRGDEIEAWLKECHRSCRYAIIDDLPLEQFSLQQQPHIFQTDPYYGLDAKTTEKIIWHLNH